MIRNEIFVSKIEITKTCVGCVTLVTSRITSRIPRHHVILDPKDLAIRCSRSRRRCLFLAISSLKHAELRVETFRKSSTAKWSILKVFFCKRFKTCFAARARIVESWVITIRTVTMFRWQKKWIILRGYTKRWGRTLFVVTRGRIFKNDLRLDLGKDRLMSARMCCDAYFMIEHFSPSSYICRAQ